MSDIAIGQVWYRKGSNEKVTVHDFYKHHGARGIGYTTGDNHSMIFGKMEKEFLHDFRAEPVTDAALLAAELKQKFEAVHGKVKVDED